VRKGGGEMMHGETNGALETMKRLYRDRYAFARDWKRNGGKVVGYHYTSVPEEVIAAAGMLPVMVTGNPSMGTEAGDKYMEDYFCPFVRSVHNLYVTGEYEFLDLSIFPQTNDSIKRCYYYLWTEKAKFPDLNAKIPPLGIFDSLHTRKYIATRYVQGRVEALRQLIGQLAGKDISRNDLLEAIEVYNENRRLLKKVAELRRADPPRITGVEALQIIGSGFFIPKKEHNRLLEAFLAGADKLPEREGTRVFVSGTIMDNTQFYELIESCGTVVVGEDVCTGNRYSDNLVDTSADPVDALADRYHTKSHEGRMSPISTLVDYIVKGAQECKAQGAIFNYLRWDDSHGWNYPSQRNGLSAIGIPSFAFEMQDYRLSGEEQLRTRIEAFLEMIRGGN
jgi:bzd-type benzoyl-CoA reductase N subunit